MNFPTTVVFLFALGKTIVSPSFCTKNEAGGPTNIDSMLVSVKYSDKTVWVCVWGEDHVGACELKELSLATCRYLCQLLAADNSVSSEF